MKFFLLPILFLYACNSNAVSDANLKKEYNRLDSIEYSKTDHSVDFLSKYSYKLIPILNDTLDGGGTCFFIKKDSFYYLVTNYHVFTNQDTWRANWFTIYPTLRSKVIATCLFIT